MAGLTLYGSEMSYFSGKARSYLRWKGLEFEEIRPTPQIMKETLLPVIGWPVIPVLQLEDGTMVQDTADSIDAVERRQPSPSVFHSGQVRRFISQLLHLYADEWLTLPAMHYRWNHNLDWIYGEFGRGALPDGSPQEQEEAGKAVGNRFRSFVPMLGINEETGPAIEASYEALLSELSVHFDKHDFIFGSVPGLADFALFGPLYAHQYRDPYSGEHMRRVAPLVAKWVERMLALDGEETTQDEGESIPETLVPILARQMKEQLPDLEATIPLFLDWANTAEPGSEVPRGLGMVELDLDGAKAPRAARSFPLLRLQTALDVLKGLDADQMQIAKTVLSAAGGDALFDLPSFPRLERKNYRLCLA